jgi:hypothetical protein
MTDGRSGFRQIAMRLTAHAQRMLPPARAEWANAIRNEIDHIPGGRAALVWALGCVFASYRERMRAMIMRNARISRWVLIVEMLFCFAPLTLLCLAVIANLGRMEGKEGLLALTVAAAGPIGLVVAFKAVVLNRPSLNKIAIAALCILAAWTVLAYSLQIRADNAPVGEWWRDLVLIAVLPALGVAHLVYMATRPIKKAPNP